MQKSCPAYFSFWFFSNNSSDVSPLYGTRYSFYEFIYFSWFSLLLYFRISRLGNATLNLTDSQGWKFMCCSHSQDLCQHARLAGSWLAAQEWTLEQPIRCQVGKLEQLLTMTQTQKFPLQWSQAEELVSILKRWQGVEGENVDDDWWGTRRVPQEEAFELASGSGRIESVDSIWCR